MISYQTIENRNPIYNRHYKLIFFSLILFIPLLTKAQKEGIKISTSAYGFSSSGDDLPFWMISNQQGIFEDVSGTYQIGDLSFHKDFKEKNELRRSYRWHNRHHKWDYSFGARGIYALNDTSSYFQPNEWYAGIRYESFILTAGAFANDLQYDGLSSSNGNIDWSNNSRPMPRVQLSTDGYIPIPFGKRSRFWRNVSIKAVYEEAFLNDDSRYVQNAHLHHKSFYIRKKIGNREHITFGGDHYAMWGGTSPVYGELPGIENYWRTIFIQVGSKDGPGSDQKYYSNHLGMYYVDYAKTYAGGTFNIYINHPFERLPAVVHNLLDNLIGLNFKLDHKALFSNILIEVMSTNDQSGVMHVRDIENGDPSAYYEQFFRHGTYKSGFTYENRIIASPFLSPIIIKDGVNLGTGNNRVTLLHLAAQGYLHPNFSWKYMFTYCRSSGTYNGQAYDVIIPGYFDMTRHKFSQILELNYNIPKAGVNILVAAAADNGHWDNLYGVRFKLEKSFSLFND